MGLFVVARLAAKHGIRVRLRSGAAGGLDALVWLPDEAITGADWFRRGRQAAGRVASSAGTQDWASPADAGWRAAEVVQVPVSDGITPAGLPRRLPRANLVPGTAGGSAANAPAPATAPPGRSAAATRERFASFQRGVRMGRAAANETRSDSGEDDGFR
jgi:hypothetical protein